MSDQLQSDPRLLAPASPAVVSRLRSPKARRLMLIGVIAVGCLAVAWMFTQSSHKPAVEAYRQQSRQRVDYEPPKAPPPPPVQQVAMVLPPPPVSLPVQAPAPMPVAPVTKAEPSPAVYSYGTPAGGLPAYMQPKPASSGMPGGADAKGGIAYKATTLEGAKAFTIADQSLILPPQPILCITDTLIVTGAQGETPFQCHLERDVLSPTNITLMERGTVVTGSYKSISGEGQNRIVAVTAFARTPNGVVVPLGGPVADELGAAGVPGSVDNHWMQRIGGAMILALADAGISLGQSALTQNGTTSINVGSGGSALTGLSQQLLAKTINIPPTITLNQGTRVTLWTMRFIDFGEAYRLERAR